MPNGFFSIRPALLLLPIFAPSLNIFDLANRGCLLRNNGAD
jgi:hypothetical protein|tara:strand:- start:67 stop:189 length:123 start_codon:yes stop_codon:yes gene_type:complete